MVLLPRFAGLTLVAGLLLCVPTLGGSAPAPAPQKKAAKNAAVSAHHHILQELGVARHLVHQANHDYKGHRARAEHEITRAIHALEPNHKHHPAHPTGTKGEGHHHEPQAVSDRQLREAIHKLEQVRSQLGSARGGNVTGASHHVTAAIHELHTALKIN
jgi:hypothetical protein